MRVILNPPEGVIGSGIYYPLNTDFKVWLEAVRLFEEGGGLSVLRAVKLCYKNKHPDDLNEAVHLLTDFMSGGEKPHNTGGVKLLSFSCDEELIYASFMSEYGIDLAKVNLHWHRFLALLKNLGGDTALMRVIAIRSANPSDIKNPKERQKLLRKKRLFSLKNSTASVGEVLSGLFEGGEKCQK